MRSPILGTLNTNASKVMANQAQKCQYHLIERCTWPQCNHSCPKLHNPFTGELNKNENGKHNNRECVISDLRRQCRIIQVCFMCR